jgi:hypothetical protein
MIILLKLIKGFVHNNLWSILRINSLITVVLTSINFDLFMADSRFIGITFLLFTLFLFYYFKPDMIVTNLKNRITLFIFFFHLL